MVKTQQNLIKSQKTTKFKKLLKLGKRKNTQNFAYEKPSKLAKCEHLKHPKNNKSCLKIKKE